MEIIFRIKKAAAAVFIVLLCMLLLQTPETKIEEDNLALRYERQLAAVFGEDSRISPGKVMTGYYLDKDTGQPDVNKPYRYIQWELYYTDAYGCPAAFTFNNSGSEMTRAVRSHLTGRVESYYNENFFQQYIRPYVDEDSVMYCKFYPLFSDPKRPETGIMFDERIQYEMDILKHARLKEMRYETVFDEYPVILSMHARVRWKEMSQEERESKMEFLETQLDCMTEAMIQYSGACLNGSFDITFLGDDGPEASIGYQILNGERYTGEEYQVDLHEAYFGPVHLDTF